MRAESSEPRLVFESANGRLNRTRLEGIFLVMMVSMMFQFASSLLLWAFILLALQLLLGGGGVAGRLEHLPAWARFAATLAAYPAGIATARHVFEPFSVRSALRFAARAWRSGLGCSFS